MPDDNRISAEITDEVKAQVITKLQEALDLLPFLVNLSADEKRNIPTISTERGAMDETFSQEINPLFPPSGPAQRLFQEPPTKSKFLL